jgi:hypothetical protein
MINVANQVGDATLLALVQGCTGLRLLSLTGTEGESGALTDAAITQLAEVCIMTSAHLAL